MYQSGIWIQTTDSQVWLTQQKVMKRNLALWIDHKVIHRTGELDSNLHDVDL